MKDTYTLKDALAFNPTGKKYNAVAIIASIMEIKQHKEYFNFDFENLFNQGYTIFKSNCIIHTFCPSLAPVSHLRYSLPAGARLAQRISCLLFCRLYRQLQ